MAVPVEDTLAVGSKITAAWANADVRDAINFLLSPPRCYAYQSAATSLVTNVWSGGLALAGEDYDTDSMHDTVTNNSRVVFKTVGRYLLVGQVAITANSTGEVRAATIELNAAGVHGGGTTLGTNVAYTASATLNCYVPVVAEYVTSVTTDYVELFGFQKSGVSLNTITGVGNSFLRARWMST